MFLVVAYLLLPSAQRLVDGQLHRGGDSVRIHNHLAVHVSCRTARGLRQTAVTAQESLLVSIEDGHERHLGQVEALSQQVHAHEHIVVAQSQVVEYLHPFQRLHLTVDVVRPHPVSHQVVGHLLRHPFRQRRHEHALATLLEDLYLVQQVVDLVLARSHLYLWIQQARRTDHLFHHDALGLLQLEVGRRRTHVDHLVYLLLELLEAQRTVVEGGGQTETVLHEVLLAAAVAAVHTVDLRHAHVTLVDEEQIVVWEEVEQAVGPFARLAAVEVAAVVLDARTVPQLLDHLHIVLHALLDPLRLDAVAQLLEEGYLLHQVVLDVVDGYVRLFLRGHKEVGGVELIILELRQAVEGHAVQLLDGIHLIVPERDAQHHLRIGHRYIHSVALHAEVAALQVEVVSYIERLY